MAQRFNYLDFLSPHTRMKPRFAALTEAVLHQANDLFSLLDSLPAAWNPEEAVGAQLDAFGALAGIPRPENVSDSDYRFFLRARLALRQWDGTNESLSDVLSRAFPDRTARLTDNQDGTVTVSLSGSAPPVCRTRNC